MNIENYLRFVPDIEQSIVDSKMDSLVVGMGPTAWLLPWISTRLLSKLRVWGAHDAWRIYPTEDLVLFDCPMNSRRLHLAGDPLKYIINSRPKRLWIYEGNYKSYEPLLHYPVESVTTRVPMFVWHNPKHRAKRPDTDKFSLESDPVETIYISPTGMTTLAWREGCRRIGILGVEMNRDHESHQWRVPVDKFFCDMADQAHQKGGLIKNLSPITALERFRSWTPSASSSAPIPGNSELAPNASSNTASASTSLPAGR